MFRSLRFYSVVSPWPDSEQALSEQLLRAAFKPCGPYAERSSGFEPPVAGRQSLLARRVAGVDFLKLRSQVRVLPSAAVKEALEARLDEYRTRTQEEPGRRVRQQLKEQTRDDLLPKALLKSERTSALYLVPERVLAVGSASDRRAERFVETLRSALGKLEVRPLAFDRPFADLLRWVFRGDGPRELIAGTECRLKDPRDGKAQVRWQNVDLAHAGVRECLRGGMELTHLGFELGNVLGGVLDANGAITKLALLGLDEPAADAAGDPLAEQDAEIALLGGTLRQLVATLRQSLGEAGSAEEAEEPAAEAVPSVLADARLAAV